MQNNFFKLANKLTKQGDLFIEKFGTKNFHEKARDLLLSAKLHEAFDYEALVKRSFLSSFSQEQNFKALEFSDLPLTISRGAVCFIDIYFWRRRPTTIHNHHFAGAFQCLRGVNLDTAFTFKKVQALTRFHTLGDLREKRIRHLNPGDIEAIDLQDKFIHQNHHHADLTVNLCFRTPDFEQKNLSHFLYSGLKIEKDQSSLLRAQRLMAYTKLGDFDVKVLNVTLTDAINFLYLSADSEIVHPRFVKTRTYLAKKVKEQAGISVDELLRQHENKLEELMGSYG